MKDLQKVFDEEFEIQLSIHEKAWIEWREKFDSDGANEIKVYDIYIDKEFSKVKNKLIEGTRKNLFLKEIYDSSSRASYGAPNKLDIKRLWKDYVLDKYLGYREYDILNIRKEDHNYLIELTKKENEIELVKWFAFNKAWQFFRYDYRQNFNSPLSQVLVEEPKSINPSDFFINDIKIKRKNSDGLTKLSRDQTAYLFKLLGESRLIFTIGGDYLSKSVAGNLINNFTGFSSEKVRKSLGTFKPTKNQKEEIANHLSLIIKQLCPNRGTK